MRHEMSPGKPTTRRYSEAEKARAVRAVRQLRTELGTDHGTVRRVATQLGIGVESLRAWVRQAEIEGLPRVEVTRRFRRRSHLADDEHGAVLPRRSEAAHLQNTCSRDTPRATPL